MTGTTASDNLDDADEDEEHFVSLREDIHMDKETAYVGIHWAGIGSKP